MDVSVKVEGLSKRYRVGGLHSGYMTLREALAGVMLAPLQRRRGNGAGAREAIWALKNINLEVGEGEIVGVIGRNGAGKSTLLKILSRVTRPTKGRAEMRGRVGSLLEVGTGFHPDLTGRENTFLNGAILGMRKAEIRRKFDEIVAFAEIEKFIDTPVKWYSSGMYVRLAFSVAAHLEPEILMMDEVLAVGDAAFQQKCLEKMREIRLRGHTIFFVSHNMPAVARLCKRVVLLEQGEIVDDGPPQSVVSGYLRASWSVGTTREWAPGQEAPGDDVVRLRRVRTVSQAGESMIAVDIRQPMGIEIVYSVYKPGYVLEPVVDIYNEQGLNLFSSADVDGQWHVQSRSVGAYTSTVWIPGDFLGEGSFLASVSIMSRSPVPKLHAHERKAIGFQVVDCPPNALTASDLAQPYSGVLRPKLQWTTQFVPSQDESS
jgi:lipopolysaccharide transport system ATP-binding protein